VQEEVVALLYAIVNGERPKASNVDPTLPAMVDEVFYRAMSKRPEDRFANCSAFVNALQSAMAVAELAPTYGRELPGYVAAPSRPSLPASPALPASSAEWNSVYRQKWAARAFDCFMCYHSTDRKAVLEVYERLIKKGILPWMDHQHLQPGKSWHQVVESVISKVPAVVVFMGGSGHGPWQQTELNAALEEMIERKARVVPVILPDTVGTPKLPFLLRSYSWVDLRFHEPDPIDKLIWGITDRHKDD
jgi:nucleotide-binding universal stress UspA family protein